MPGSFDRPPRNIAEKISSGYKAKEWQNYYYGLAPALLYGILPPAYWRNYCKLVYAIRLLHQKVILRKHVQDAHKYLSEFHEEFEDLYVRRQINRLHFMRPCLHALLHMASETVRLGPVTLSSTWTMERMIGFLGSQIRQPSNPYHNLSERGLRQCQINSLVLEYPELNRSKDLNEPQYSEPLGDGYLFLRARERNGRIHQGVVGEKVRDWFVAEETKAGNSIPLNWPGPKIRRWARLSLPNGQIARTAWKETQKPADKVRRARMVKLARNGTIEFAEVLFFFYGAINGELRPQAAIKLFSRPDADLFHQSCFTVWSVTCIDDDIGICIVPAKCITAVVAVIPHSIPANGPHDVQRFFIWEQFGKEIALWSEALNNPSDEADEVVPGDED